MSQSSYSSLIKSFLAVCAPDQPALAEEPGELQFTLQGRTCTVFESEGGGRLVLVCQVMDLAELGADRLQAALRMLHGLNWVTAQASGTVALVDDTDAVFVSRMLDAALIDAQQLGDIMGEVMEEAANLATLLRNLSPGQAAAREPSAEALQARFGPAGGPLRV